MEKLTMNAVITIVGAVVSVAAAIFTAAQARFAKRQAVAAEEQAAAAKVQADLAKAQLDQLKRSEDEEAAHQRWVEGVLAELRKPGTELVHVKPGDHLHAEWALKRGYVEPVSTSIGTALVLPAAERAQIPGSPDAKMREARREILTACAEHPGAWCTWEHHAVPDWQTFSAAAERLDNEGLADTRPAIGAVAIRITTEGIAAVHRGAF